MVCGYGAQHRSAKVMVMLKAYFDDSSGDEGSKICILAGVVQRYTVWADFSFAWEAELVRHPSIKYFHMREARSLTGEFAGWKRVTADAKTKRLAAVAASYSPWTIAAWISRKEHDAILKPIAPFMLRHSYFSLFYAVILNLVLWNYHRGVNLPIDFVFDQQGPVGAEAALLYEYIKSIQKPEIAALLGSSPEFKDDKMVLPLQAADMLAWHVRRRKDRPTEDESQWPTAPVAGLLHADVHITKESLMTMASEMAQVPGIDLVPQKGKDYKKFNAAIKEMLRRELKS